MRVLICPDKFAGTISAVDAAAALAAGWREGAPPGRDTVTVRPLADGGPGFLEALAAAPGGDAATGPARRPGQEGPGERVAVATEDPRGRPVGGWIVRAGDTAYVESAQACGLHLLTAAERDPLVTSSYGLGTLLAAAAGAREVVVGLGGSAVNDAGAGVLAALGAPPVDAAGAPLPPGGAALARVARLGGIPALPAPSLVVATDVDNPLLGPDGATRVFGPQKGATAEDVEVLEPALARYAGVLVREVPGCPPDLGALPGGGAAGGLGAALLALGGRREPGARLVQRLTGFDAALAEADLVLTGEGSFDAQSLRGKVVAGVAAAARTAGVPCVVVAGRVTVEPASAAAAGVTAAYPLVDQFGGNVAAAMARPAEGLRAVAARLASRGERAADEMV